MLQIGRSLVRLVRDKQRFGAVDERAELERGIVVSDIVVWCLVSTESGR